MMDCDLIGGPLDGQTVQVEDFALEIGFEIHWYSMRDGRVDEELIYRFIGYGAYIFNRRERLNVQ